MSDPGRPVLNPDELATKSFEVVRRGFDPTAVRALLTELAGEIRTLQRRERDLEQRLREVPEPVLPAEVDEESLVGAVGIETARILQAAHDAARDIVARAERRASALVTDAEGAFAERTRLADSEAAEMRANVRDEVLYLQQKAREECREMVDEAREARRKILSDLVERRRALHLQLEQMRAGKDALAGIIESVSYSVVSSVEEVRARLEGSEEAARLAAASAVVDPSVEAELALDALEIEELAVASPALGAPRAIEAAPARPPAVFAESDPFENAAVVAQAAESVVDAPEAPADPESTPDEPAEAPPVSEERAAEGNANGIDALFERIRNSRTESVAAARKVLDASAVGVEVTEVVEIDEVVVAVAATDADSAEPTPISQRNLVLDPAIVDLGRSLKRALRVEENELRDTARHLPKDPGALSELIQPSTHARIVDAAERSLAQAVNAGHAFAGSILGLDLPEIASDEPRTIAEALATEIVEPLRQRIESAQRESEGDADPSTAVGVAFRDWRGPRVEAVAGDFATWAFAAGVIAAATAAGVEVSWLVDDGATNCPDCEDNALAGAIVPGGEFPTGQAHPPIHPGCRCVLVPTQNS